MLRGHLQQAINSLLEEVEIPSERTEQPIFVRVSQHLSKPSRRMHERTITLLSPVRKESKMIDLDKVRSWQSSRQLFLVY